MQIRDRDVPWLLQQVCDLSTCLAIALLAHGTSGLYKTPNHGALYAYFNLHGPKKAWGQVLQKKQGKSIVQVSDTGTRVLDNTRPFLCSSIVSFWITLACSEECKYHIFGQYWYTKTVPVLTNTGTFQYLGPEVYFFQSRIYMSQFNVYRTFCRKIEIKLENMSPWQTRTHTLGSKIIPMGPRLLYSALDLSATLPPSI